MVSSRPLELTEPLEQYDEVQALAAARRHAIDVNICESAFGRLRSDIRTWFYDNPDYPMMPNAFIKKLFKKYRKKDED